MEWEAGCEATEAVWVCRQAVSTRHVQRGLHGNADDSIRVRAVAQAPWKPHVAALPMYSPRLADDLPDCITGKTSPWKMDIYNEEETEVDWLMSKPLCVLIVGKLQRDAAKLAHAFSRHWGCLCVEPDAAARDLPQLVGSQLSSGAATPGRLVMLLMKKQLMSAEARHRGYVLTGLPYMPSLDEDLSAQDQLADLFSLPMPPDIIIHLACSDDEVYSKGKDACYDLYSGFSTYRSVFQAVTKKQHSQMNHDLSIYKELLQESNCIDPKHKNHLVQLPQDMEKGVTDYLQKYKQLISHAIDNCIAAFHPENVIRVDGRTTFAHMLQVVLARLKTLSKSKAYVPKQLGKVEEVQVIDEENEQGNEVEAEPEEEIIDDDEPGEINLDAMYDMVKKMGTVSSHFKWTLSHWGGYCPVSLVNGFLTQGKLKFAVSFLDKVYFLSSKENMELFIQNPRTFLLPPNPRLPCKLAVVGAHLSGKTVLAEFLARVFYGKVIETSKLMADLKELRRNEHISACRQAALENAYEELYGEQERERAEKAAAWMEETVEALTEILEEYGAETFQDEGSKKSIFEEAEQEIKMYESKSDTEYSEESNTVTTPIGTFGIKYCRKLIADPELLTEMMPEDLRKKPVNFEKLYKKKAVRQVVDEAVAEAEEDEIELIPEDIASTLIQAIEEVEKEQSDSNDPLQAGWVFDDFPLNLDVWNALHEARHLPDAVVYLKDMEENFAYLVSKYDERKSAEVSAADLLEQYCGSPKKEKRITRDCMSDVFKKTITSPNDIALTILCDTVSKETFEEDVEENVEEDVEENFQENVEENVEENFEENVEENFEENVEEDVEENFQENVEENVEENFEETSASAMSKTCYDEILEAVELYAAKMEEQDHMLCDEVEEEEAPIQASESTILYIRHLVECVALNEEQESSASEAAQEASLLGTESFTVPSDEQPEEEQEEYLVGLSAESLEDESEGQIIADYRESITQVDNDWHALPRNMFKTHMLQYNLSNKSLSQMVTDVVKMLEGLLRVRAVPLPEDEEEESEEEEEEEEEDEEKTLGEEEETERKVDATAISKRIKVLSDTGSYCPYAYYTYNILREGRMDLAIRYQNKVHYMSSQNAYDELKMRPWNFRPMQSPLPNLPPLRIYVVGTIGSGKSTIAKIMSTIFGVLCVDFLDEVDKKIAHVQKKKIGRKHEDLVDGYEEYPIEEDWQPSEDVDNVKSYLLNGTNLHEHILNALISPWWQKDPGSSAGFFYAGFPFRSGDADYIKTHGFFPDAFLHLSVPGNIVKKRIFRIYVDLWEQRQDKLKQIVADRDAGIMKEWEDAKEKRREQLFEEYKERKYLLAMYGDTYEMERKSTAAANIESRVSSVVAATSSEVREAKSIQGHTVSWKPLAEPSPLDDASEDDVEEIIEEIIKEEIPEPVLLHNWETKQDAKRRISDQISQWFELDNSHIYKLQDFASDENIPWIEINARAPLDVVILNSLAAISKYKLRTPAIFESVFIISVDNAENLLSSGYYFLSKFGRWCPVQIFKGDIPIQMYIPQKDKELLFPVIHRKYIYFISSKKNCESFLKDPMKYINQESNFPNLPIKLAILGPPKSGKTKLAEELSRELGVKVVTPGQSLRYTLEEIPTSNLSISIEDKLRFGASVPSHLLVSAIEVATMDPRGATQGFVLDGFPNTQEESQLLENIGIIPYIFIILRCSISTSEKNLKKISANFYRQGPIYSVELLHYKYNIWEEAVTKNLAQLSFENKNLLFSTEDKSNWKAHQDIKTKIFVVMQSYNKYFQDIDKGSALSLEHSCISTNEFGLRQNNRFKNYCPVCLGFDGALVMGNIQNDRRGLLEYNGFFYWVCMSHLRNFIKKPYIYVQPINVANVPKEVPFSVYADSPDGVELKKDIFKDGYCVVTYCQNLPYRVLMKGQPHLVVEYTDRTFLFSTEDHLHKFMRHPQKYINEDMHSIKLNNPEIQPTKVQLFPILGFLQQFAADIVSQCIISVGSLRPKYPFMDPATSVALYIGFYLKVNNQNAPLEEKLIFAKGWKDFKQKCALLTSTEHQTRMLELYPLKNLLV